MKQILQSIERRNKTATKYKFQFEPKQLTIETDNKFCPEQIEIVCIHRNRRVISKPRQLESSCTIDCRHLILWPESLADLIEFETTFYKRDADDLLDDKNWTIVLESIIIKKTRNGKIKSRRRTALASADINMKSILGSPGQFAELQICMRPLYDAIKYCQIDFHVHSTIQEQAFIKSTTPWRANFPEHPQIAINNGNSPELLASINNTKTKPDLDIQDELEILIPQMIVDKFSSLDSTPLVSTNNTSQQQNHQINNGNDGHGQSTVTTQMLSTIANVLKDDEKELHRISQKFVKVEEQKAIIALDNQFSDMPFTIRSPTPPLKISTPAAPHSQMIINNKNRWNSPRFTSNSSTRTKPVPPSQAEVQAVIAQMFANKRPDLASTPLTSRTTNTLQHHQNTNIGHEHLSTRQSSIPNALKEKTKKIEEELNKVSQEFAKVEEQKAFVLEKLADYEENSEKEQELIEHKQRLVNEMAQLSRRQDYLNVQLEWEEVDFKIGHLRSMLATANSPTEEDVDGIGGSNRQKHRRDSQALLELKKLMDLKEMLTHQLSDMEADDEEDIERNRLVLETTRNQNFLRGSQDTFNMSKRLMNWISGAEQRFKQ